MFPHFAMPEEIKYCNFVKAGPQTFQRNEQKEGGAEKNLSHPLCVGATRAKRCALAGLRRMQQSPARNPQACVHIAGSQMAKEG